MRTIFLYVVSIACFSISLNKVSGQSVHSFIQELCSAKWIGHYQNSEDSNLVHTLQWVIEYDGKIARALKSVPELDFLMETSIYYDFEHACYSSLTLLNKSMISKGMVSMDDNHLIIQGRSYFEDGSREFRIEYSLNDIGQLEDRFFRKTNDGDWTQGHFILYKPVTIQPEH